MRARKTKNAMFAFILLWVVLLCDSCFFMHFARDGNYVVAEYRDGNVVFYQSGNLEFTEFPHIGTSFIVMKSAMKNSPVKNVWRSVLAAGEVKKCRDLNDYNIAIEHIRLSIIKYGVTPRCFDDLVPAQPLRKNVDYFVSQGYVPKKGKLEEVHFKIVDCDEARGKICLETNSPTRLLERK